jgi:hypothetical protein
VQIKLENFQQVVFDLVTGLLSLISKQNCSQIMLLEKEIILLENKRLTIM